ncbi:MAG: leucine-rich repeat domain-containing protein [Candidatus Aenigmarchaeota archaeon]|nr:leucine-rich repeat domain-containing protein [Candidatus Aenigmarchaeota archaeon]
MNKNLKDLAKEHADSSINAPVIESVFALGDYEISAMEYKALEEITALYGSTPEEEYKNRRIDAYGEGVTYLNMAGKGLSELPDSIGNLSSLQRLYVHNNSLQYLPDSIRNLKNLQQFDVDDNKLTKKEEEKLKKLFGDRVWV